MGSDGEDEGPECAAKRARREGWAAVAGGKRKIPMTPAEGARKRERARIAIKRTPCRVARGKPSQKTVIGNTFPPFFLK